MLQVSELRLRGEVLSRGDLPSLVPAWDALSSRLLEDNVYYSPRYARALINSVDRDSSLRFATVWQRDTLVALLPYTRGTFETPMLGTAARAWQTDYTFNCMPLVDRTCAKASLALIELLSTINEGEWIIPTVNTTGPAYQALVNALQQDGRPWDAVNSFQRAMLETGDSFESHLQTHLSSKRRRELARNRRRLEEAGRVTHESFYSGGGLTRAVKDFLAIEARGWKGKRGTALASRPETKQFALDAFTGSATDSICRADVLKLNGTTIAVSLTVFTGNTGFTVKCAYDEAYRNYSPGLLLEVEVLHSFLSERWANRLDAGTAGVHVIDNLWPGRLEVADLIFSLSPRLAHQRLAVLAQAINARQAMRNAAKRLVTHLRWPK
jgi:CelD/BcsL family acetyltransferase involved in cellulose biosynthesis